MKKLVFNDEMVQLCTKIFCIIYRRLMKRTRIMKLIKKFGYFENEMENTGKN